MIIDDRAQMRGQRFLLSGHREERPGGEVSHPQFVDPGRFKGFGRAADGLPNQIAAAALVHRMTLQSAIDRAQGRQRGIGFLPLTIEHFDRNGRMGFNRFDHVPFLFRSQFAGQAAIRAILWMQRGKAAVLIRIPPILQRAAWHGTGLAIEFQHRLRAHRVQCHFERHRLAQELLQSADEGKTRQGHGLGASWGSIFVHARDLIEASWPGKTNPCVGLHL